MIRLPHLDSLRLCHKTPFVLALAPHNSSLLLAAVTLFSSQDDDEDGDDDDNRGRQDQDHKLQTGSEMLVPAAAPVSSKEGEDKEFRYSLELQRNVKGKSREIVDKKVTRIPEQQHHTTTTEIETLLEKRMPNKCSETITHRKENLSKGKGKHRLVLDT